MILISSGRSFDSVASNHDGYGINSSQFRRMAAALPNVQPASELRTRRETGSASMRMEIVDTESLGDGIPTSNASHGRFDHISRSVVVDKQIMTV